MKKKGAEIFVDTLVKEGVEVMFGIPGGVALPLFDALYDSKIKVILTRHEQGAAHAADGYARATGKVGVCLATSGPGATNLTTGIATAYMDSIPMVAFTAQVATNLIGNDAFQEADFTGITRPITKHNYLVKNIKDLGRVIREAFYIASTGRKGPVVVDIPVDISRAETTSANIPEKVELRSYKPVYEGHPVQIKKAAEMINSAIQPIIYAGGGVISSGASKCIKILAEKADIPVGLTLLGLGGFPANHPLYLGMFGMHGTRYANAAIMDSDLIIAVGARFDDRVTGKLDRFAPNAKIIHIDIDPSAISKNVRVDIPIVGDAKIILQELNGFIESKKHIEWKKKIEEWKKKYPLTYNKNSKSLKPQFVIEQICELTKGDAIITTEVGQNQMWTAQFYKFINPRSLLSSGGLGTMGYGFPAAIGAKIGCPDKLVIDIAGDGSFQMNIQELITAVSYKVPVKVAILNNRYLGMVRQWQELFYNRRYSCSDICSQPDFVKLAEAYGAVGLRVTESQEVRKTLEKAFSIDKPVIIDFQVDREENVFPMVPAGAPINEAIDIELA
ncbi:MAG: biosynthetic-type acetolactate synthase large subunit [Candidatus Firestonebacteria bacterium]